jgi:hypothetical protein
LGIKNGLENVEIHLKSSDWYVHHHERDEAYKHNSSCGMGTRLGNFRKNNTEIPVLELKSM